VGAGIPGDGADSLGAGIPPAGGSAFCARARDEYTAESSNRRAAQRVRVIGVSGWGEWRAIIHTAAELPSRQLKGTATATDVVLCGNLPRMFG
jgi:hypothetical protein